MKITIDHSIIKALLICAAKQDIRYYLKGVCVDARANGDVVLVATDGHRLLAYPVAVDNIEALAPGESNPRRLGVSRCQFTLT
jgi:DNA polymerase-3 subunit beta